MKRPVVKQADVLPALENGAFVLTVSADGQSLIVSTTDQVVVFERV
jgi:hypothetical protein